MVIRPFLAILLCLAGLTVNNGIGAPKMGKFSLKHGSGSIWRAQFAFRTKITWKVKCFGPLWAPAPCKNKKKTAVIAKNKPLELPRSGTNAVSRVKLDIYHPYCAYGSFIRRRFISHAQFNHHRTPSSQVSTLHTNTK